ncbi:hypothetical protein CK507_02765 [Pseudomonas sp. WN033]|nr:hypothetical protein CK507_02765 [Pseudomonas sp. WN033]
MTPLQRIEMMNSMIADINAVLAKHGIEKEICLSDVTITEKTVSDFVKPEAELSDAITNHLWPSIEIASVYHFTSRDAAESIMNSGTFRLTNIAKRFSEGEIETFCKTHNLNGYLKEDENGDPKYKHLIMPNTFYASFTGVSLTKDQEEWFWGNFAACDGVRLKFNITASNPNFRKLRYEQSEGTPIPLLYELSGCIREKYGREFILKGISRLCSFYLCGKDYGIENEYRALYRVWEGFGPQPKNSGELSYIELPLNEMSECGYKLEITEVHSVEQPEMPSAYIFSKRQA